MSKTLSVLFVSPAPDARESTIALERAAASLRDLDGVAVAVWFLRSGARPPSGATDRTIDDLRTWWPARALERMGLPPLAHRLRGLRLRSWCRAVDPDIVVLDDGFGERVLPAPHRGVIVHRRNHEAPVPAPVEAAPLHPPDGLLVDAPHRRHPTIPSYVLPPLVELAEARSLADAPARAIARSSHGLPLEGTIASSWPAIASTPEPLLDRLAANPEVHGVWADRSLDPAQAEVLRARSDRLGVGARFHARAYDAPSLRLAADLAVCDAPPATADPVALAELGAAGVAVAFGGRAEPIAVDPVPQVDERAWAEGFRAFALHLVRAANARSGT